MLWTENFDWLYKDSRSLYRGLSPSPASDIWWPRLETCSNWFTWGPHCTGPPTSADIWWLVTAVGKQAVRILLQCFLVITAHKRSLRRLCFYGCLSFCPQGGLPQCMLGYHTPWGADPPGPDTPHPNPLNQAPPKAVHPGRYVQWVGGMHPTGMQSCY